MTRLNFLKVELKLKFFFFYSFFTLLWMFLSSANDELLKQIIRKKCLNLWGDSYWSWTWGFCLYFTVTSSWLNKTFNVLTKSTNTSISWITVTVISSASRQKLYVCQTEAKSSTVCMCVCVVHVSTTTIPNVRYIFQNQIIFQIKKRLTSNKQINKCLNVCLLFSLEATGFIKLLL